MAYAELSGLPPITGLYTTVVCLVAYALAGPSPILVLGPDSSLGPMIAATILPLAAGDQNTAIALAGMLAILVGLVCLGAGIGRLGFVADLLSNPVRTGYLAGLAVVIFIGQLPKLFGFSTDASGLVAEAQAFVQGLDMTNPWALGIGLLSLGHHPRTQAGLAADAGHPDRGRRRDRAVGRARPGLARRLGHRRAAAGLPAAVPAGGPPLGHPAAVRGGDRDLAGRHRRHHLDLGRLRVTWRVRGRRRPGAGRHRCVEPGGRPVLRVPGQHQRVADGRRVPVGREDPADRSGRRRPGARDAGRRARVWSSRCRSRSWPRSSSPPRSPCSTWPSCDGCTRSARRSSRLPSRARSGSRSSACSRGSCWRSCCRPSTSSSVPGPRTRRCSGTAPNLAGYHDLTSYPEARPVPGMLIVRWSAPLFFANANEFRDRIRALVRDAAPPPALGPRRRRADHRHRHHRGLDAGRPRPRAQRGRDPPRLRRAPDGGSRHDRPLRAARDDREDATSTDPSRRRSSALQRET